MGIRNFLAIRFAIFTRDVLLKSYLKTFLSLILCANIYQHGAMFGYLKTLSEIQKLLMDLQSAEDPPKQEKKIIIFLKEMKNNKQCFVWRNTTGLYSIYCSILWKLKL